MSHTSFCWTCFASILDKTQDKLNTLRENLASIQAA